MSTIQGFVLIDVDVAALNNAGNDKTTNLDNAVATKKIRKNGKEYPYVSGQALRYWWRESLVKNHNWVMSPIIREPKIAFTEADPMKYPDDDIFGYMRAAKEEQTDDKGKKKNVNITLTRISPLKNSALIGVAYNPIIQNWASMSRQEGDAVPFGIDEYCAIMKGMFSIDLNQAGTFSTMNKTGFRNINENMKKQYLEKDAVEINDPIVKDKNGAPLKLVRLNKVEREKRVKETILALKTISGGAKQTANMTDVTPKLIVLANCKSANHPFSHLAKEDLGKAVFSIDALKEVLNDFSDQFEGKIYIGKRMGFMDELDSKLQELNDGKDCKIKFGPVNQIIDDFVNTISMEG